LWEKYVESMFQQRPLGSAATFNKDQAISWLKWLAYAMKTTNMAEFRLENIVLFTSNLAVGQPKPMAIAQNRTRTWLGFAIFRQSWNSLPDQILIALSAIFLVLYGFSYLSMPVGISLRGGALLGLAFVLSGHASFPLHSELSGLLAAVGGLTLVDTAGVGQSFYDGDSLAGEVHWYWQRLFLQRAASVMAGLGSGIIWGCVASVRVGWQAGLLEGIAVGTAITVIFGLLNGLVLTPISGMGSRTDRPDSALRRSRACTIIFGAGSAAFAGSAWWALGGPGSGSTACGLAVGVGLMMAARFGGFGLFRNYLIRRAMLRSRVAPRRYSSYLDQMSERLMLYRAVGAYQFIHRSLLEYLADSYVATSPGLLVKPISYFEDNYVRFRPAGKLKGRFKFDKNTLSIIFYAEELARTYQHNFVGTEHLLLAIIYRFPDTFERLTWLDSREMIHLLEQSLGAPDERRWGYELYGPSAQRAMRYAQFAFMRAAGKMSPLTKEYVILGIIRETSGKAGQILRDAGIDKNVVSSRIAPS